MLPPLATVAVSLGDCHGVALSTNAHTTRRLMAITVLETLRQYLLGPSGQVSMALLYFPGKMALASGLLGILEILYTSLAAL